MSRTTVKNRERESGIKTIREEAYPNGWYTKREWGERLKGRVGVYLMTTGWGPVVEDSLFFAAAGVESCRSPEWSSPSCYAGRPKARGP